MTELSIYYGGQPYLIDVDIRTELEQYEWTRPKWSYDKLIAASPFRYDTQPSFYVYIEDTPTATAGSWGDSGAIDPFYGKGGIVKLLAFLRNETEEETAEYLIDTYGMISSLVAHHVSELDLSRYRRDTKPKPLDDAIITQHIGIHSYLSSRGISEDVQRKMRTGYDKKRKAIVIPWYTADNRLANVKYRRIDSKTFWYEKGAVPIRELIYGMDVVYKERAKTAILCEAEIDAMTCMSAGYTAIATGGSYFNPVKRDIIARSPIERLYIATDNDEAGEKLKRQVIDMLRGYVELYDIKIREAKDLNEAGLEMITEFVEKAERVETLVLTLNTT